MITTRIRLFVLSLFVAFAAGCGGGGSPEAGVDAKPLEPRTWSMQVASTNLGWGARTLALPDSTTLLLGMHDQDAIVGFGKQGATPVTAGGSQINGFLSRVDADGNPMWTVGFTSNELASPQRMVALADGTCFVAGNFTGTLVVAEGTPSETTLVSAGGQDAFLARCSANGDVDWAVRIGSAAFEQGHAVTVRPNGDVIFSGVYGAAVTLGAGETNETTLVAGPGGNDAFVACYTPAGALVWAKAIVTAAPSSYVNAWDMDAMGDNRIAVVGPIGGSVTFGVGETNERTLVSTAASKDVYVGLLEQDGSLAWVRQGGGVTPDHLNGVCVDSNGTIHAGGSFAGADTTFEGNGQDSRTLQAQNGAVAAFVMSYDDQGGIVRDVLVCESDETSVMSLEVLGDGSMVVGGYFRGSTRFADGEALETTLTTAGGSDAQDGYVAGYAPDGSMAFVTQLRGDGWQSVGSVRVHQDGSILATGYFQTGLQIGDELAPAIDMTAQGFYDGFLVRLGPDGAPGAPEVQEPEAPPAN